jgi:Fic family protein
MIENQHFQIMSVWIRIKLLDLVLEFNFIKYMNFIDSKYFVEYNNLVGNKIEKLVNQFELSENKIDFAYSVQSSAVYSSNIEGNSIDLNSFMNYKLSNTKLRPQKELREIEDLIAAYDFANQNKLNETNFLQCHKILTKSLLIKSKQGKYRREQVGVFDSSGLVYLAVEPEFVKQEMSILFENIAELLNKTLSVNDTFYYASFIHLKLTHIHPLMDGNGRIARLVEKWFLCEKLGSKFWKLQSEKYYKVHQSDYYNNINLGVNYFELNYKKCIPFLLMLTNSFE